MSIENETKPQTIYRIIKDRDFVQIHKSALYDDRLSLKSKGLLCIMLSMPDDWQFHRNHLLKLSTDGKDGLASGLKELRQLGYVTLSDERDERGRITKWIVSVYEKAPAVVAEGVYPEADFPDLANPDLVNPPVTNNKTNTNNDLTNKNILCFEKIKSLSTNTKTSNADIQKVFDRLWEVYPLKKGKQKALEALEKALKGKAKEEAESLAMTIWGGLNACIAEHEAKTQLQTQGGEIWVPNLPHLSTWLAQNRWTDEYQDPRDILANIKRKKGGLDLSAIESQWR